MNWPESKIIKIRLRKKVSQIKIKSFLGQRRRNKSETKISNSGKSFPFCGEFYNFKNEILNNIFAQTKTRGKMMDIGVSEYGKYLSIYIQLYQSIFRIEIDSIRTNFERVEFPFFFEIDSFCRILSLYSMFLST